MYHVPQHDVQDLILQLQEEDVSLRLDALALLGDMGDTGDIDDMEELGDEDETQHPPEQAGRLIQAILQALRDENVQIRKMAVLALGDIGPITPDVVPALIESLGDPNAEVRRRAAITLGELQAHQARFALQQALRDNDEKVRKAAIQALDEFEE